MYGTNDLDYGSNEKYLRAQFWRMYTQHMFTIVDTLIDRGIVPVLSSIPFAEQQPSKAQAVNAIVRGMAQARQILFVDFYASLWPLPRHGLGDDGVHPSVYFQPEGVPRACIFTAAGLQAGMDMRNLVTIEALRRAHEVVGLNVPALDPDPTPVPGTGTTADPIQAGALPFSDMRPRPQASIALAYSGCPATTSGRALVYRVTFLQATAIRALVLRPQGYEPCKNANETCDGVTDTSISLAQGGACLETENTEILRIAAAGTYDLIIDSSADLADEALMLVLMQCEPGDAQCGT
jgi:hypothetical protein